MLQNLTIIDFFSSREALEVDGCWETGQVQTAVHQDERGVHSQNGEVLWGAPRCQTISMQVRLSDIDKSMAVLWSNIEMLG